MTNPYRDGMSYQIPSIDGNRLPKCTNCRGTGEVSIRPPKGETMCVFSGLCPMCGGSGYIPDYPAPTIEYDHFKIVPPDPCDGQKPGLITPARWKAIRPWVFATFILGIAFMVFG